MRRALMTTVMALAVIACAGDPYPMPAASSSHSSQRNPAAVGEATDAVLIFMTVRPDDRITLIDAEAIGMTDGADVEFLLSRSVLKSDGSSVIGEQFEELEGAVVSDSAASAGGQTTVGIVGRLTALRPGRFEISNVRLRYRLNGGRERVGEGIDVTWSVCADDPAPAECAELADRFVAGTCGASAQEAELVRAGDSVAAGGHAELREDVLRVGPQGVDRDVQLAGDVRAGEVAGEEAEHLELAVAERLDERLLRRGGWGVIKGGDQPVDVGVAAAGDERSRKRASIGGPSSTKVGGSLRAPRSRGLHRAGQGGDESPASEALTPKEERLGLASSAPTGIGCSGESIEEHGHDAVVRAASEPTSSRPSERCSNSRRYAGSSSVESADRGPTALRRRAVPAEPRSGADRRDRADVRKEVRGVAALGLVEQLDRLVEPALGLAQPRQGDP